MNRAFIVGFFAALACGTAVADEPPKREKPKYVYQVEHDPDGIGKFYMDREIAQVMGYGAAGWLERKERVKEEDPAKLIKLLDVKEGMVVADVGANPMEYGNQQLLLNSDALKQLLYGPIDGPPRNTMQIGQPG